MAASSDVRERQQSRVLLGAWQGSSPAVGRDALCACPSWAQGLPSECHPSTLSLSWSCPELVLGQLCTAQPHSAGVQKRVGQSDPWAAWAKARPNHLSWAGRKPWNFWIIHFYTWGKTKQNKTKTTKKNFSFLFECSLIGTGRADDSENNPTLTLICGNYLRVYTFATVLAARLKKIHNSYNSIQGLPAYTSCMAEFRLGGVTEIKYLIKLQDRRRRERPWKYFSFRCWCKLWGKKVFERHCGGSV